MARNYTKMLAPAALARPPVRCGFLHALGGCGRLGRLSRCRRRTAGASTPTPRQAGVAPRGDAAGRGRGRQAGVRTAAALAAPAPAADRCRGALGRRRAHRRAALDGGRGLVFLTPHLGCFEVTRAGLRRAFRRRVSRSPCCTARRASRWLRDAGRARARAARPAAAPATLAGVRQMLRALRRGEAVGLLPDQVPPEGMGVWAPFFGRPAYTMTLAARLAQQTGAVPLVLAWGERLPRGAGYVVHVLGLRRAVAQMPAAPRQECGRRGRQPRDGGADPRSARSSTCGATTATRRRRRAARGAAALSERRCMAARLLLACSGCCTGCRWARRRCSGARSARCCTPSRGSRRRIALRNVELCFPELEPRRAPRPGARALRLARPQPARARPALVRPPGAAAPPDPRRRRRAARRAQRSAGDVAGAALHGAGRGRRRDAALPDALGGVDLPGAEQPPCSMRRMRRGRLRLGNGEIFARSERALPLVRAIRRGAAFFNLPDMDFGERDAAFVPFFGHPGGHAAGAVAAGDGAGHGGAAGASARSCRAAGLSRALPRAAGPTGRRDDALADTAAHEPLDRSRASAPDPAQYLWVHKRFKTRPPGEAIAVRRPLTPRSIIRGQ